MAQNLQVDPADLVNFVNVVVLVSSTTFVLARSGEGKGGDRNTWECMDAREH